MVQKILKLKPALLVALASKSGLDSKISFFNNEWFLMEKIQNVLSIFEKATKFLQYKDACISCYIPIVTTIIRELSEITNEDEGVKAMKRGLLVNMKKRFHDIESIDEFFLATYLDPTYKCWYFRMSDTKERARNILMKKIEEGICKSRKDVSTTEPILDESESSQNGENSFEKKMAKLIQCESTTNNEESDLRSNIKEALQKFENSPTLKFRKSPLQFWKVVEADTEKPWTKQMAILAKVYLTPPPTSADVERLFSSGSNVLNKFRNRLLPHNSEKLLFCHENMSRVNYQFY
jgi:hypothetical protein